MRYPARERQDSLRVQGENSNRMSTSIQDVSAETLAKLFHHYQQRLSQPTDCGKGSECGESWEDVPAQERRRLVTAAGLTLMELDSLDSDSKASRRYFAKPGEAEWGC